jgi:hypothetical protein
VTFLASAGRCLRSLAAAALLGATSCAGTRDPLPAPGSEPKPGGAVPANWPAPPPEIERRLASEAFELRSATSAGGGLTGALKLDLFFPASGDTLAFKWKPIPNADADGWNNTPRKELATYALQAWFLEPADYVVPTVAMRCLPPEELRAQGVDAEPNLPGIRCVLGMLALWLEQVTIPDDIFDAKRFAADPRYATSVGRLNLLTYLVEHTDGREGNFLASTVADDPRYFSIDNGITFGTFLSNWFVPNWNVIRVPALPHIEIERLRKVERSQIDRLGALAEMQANTDGVLVSVPPVMNRDPDRGTQVTPDRLQLGLTRSELDAIETRLRTLLERVDRGELPVF